MPHPSSRRALTPSQQDLMKTLTRLGNGAPVSISTPKLAAAAELTVKQVDAAISGLVDATILSKAWNPDQYVWTYTLHVPLAGS